MRNCESPVRSAKPGPAQDLGWALRWESKEVDCAHGLCHRPYEFCNTGDDPVGGDVAADGYPKYKEDIKLMTETGLAAYRFSISWSRLIPYGRREVNPKGLEYYNDLINELLDHGP